MAISKFRLRSRVRVWQVAYQNGDMFVPIRISISINNAAGAPAKSLRMSRWRWVAVNPVVIRGCQISRLSYPYGTYRVDTGLRYKVKGKIAAGACLYNIETRTSIIGLERHVCPPGAKGRPWVDSFKRRPCVLRGFSFRNNRARPQGVSS